MTNIGALSDDEFASLLGNTHHEAGCSYGGFSCGYWLVAEGCDQPHWEAHVVLEDGFCPCGNAFPGAASETVFCTREGEEG